MATKKTVADVDVKGKRVLMRVDFNVPLEGGKITDDRRIVQAMPTIKSVIERGGRLILMSHLGRPKGGPEAKYSLKPVAARLARAGEPVPGGAAPARRGPQRHRPAHHEGPRREVGRHALRACCSPATASARRSRRPRSDLKDGDVLLLENLRFHKEEEKNDPNFAQQLAKLGDVYVNDAFGTAHREHASTFGVPQAHAGQAARDRVPDPEGAEVPRRRGHQARSARSSRSSAGRRSPTRSTSSSSCSARPTRC